jgi:hypothetical protein
MAKHHSAIDSDPTLGRKRTADLLRQLRNAPKDVRSLKSQVTDLEKRDLAAGVVRRLIAPRRAN